MPELWTQDVALLLLVWLIAHHYQARYLVATMRETEPEPQKGTRQKKAAGEFQGLTIKPACDACEAEVPVMSRVPPPLIEHQQGRPKSVPTELQFCPNEGCRYYGWVGLGNISANGRPNRGPHRQLYCCACKKWFMETKGTLF